MHRSIKISKHHHVKVWLDTIKYDGWHWHWDTHITTGHNLVAVIGRLYIALWLTGY